MSALSDEENFTKIVACSDCFHDVGLRAEALSFATTADSRCPQCGSYGGAKLTKEALRNLVVEFFWNGSWLRTDFGGAHRIVCNEQRFGRSDVEFPPWIKPDADLVQELLKEGFFHYGPQLWRLGEVEPLKELQMWRSRRRAALKMVDLFPARTLRTETTFFRIRKNLGPGEEQSPSQYDSAPKRWRGNGRLDSRNLSVLYASENLEICLHECRITIPDECFVAELAATRPLRLLDLCVEPDEDGPTPFESSHIAVRFLFAASSQSYKFTRALALAARDRGYDGMFYPSFFSLVKEDSIDNIAIFGRPLASGAVRLKGVNRAMLKSASYGVRFGPLFG